MQTLSEIIRQKTEERNKRAGIVEQPRTLTESELAWERAKKHLSTLPKDIPGMIMEKALKHEPFMYKESQHGTSKRYWARLEDCVIPMASKTYSYKVETIMYERATGQIKDAYYVVLNEDPHVVFERVLFKKDQNVG